VSSSCFFKMFMCEVLKNLNMFFNKIHNKHNLQQINQKTHNNNKMIKEFTPNWVTSP
jgi:hypothetical protein